MESMRQQKMGRQVQKELSEIFIRHSREYFESTMVSITQVKMSPDLGLARVYLSLFPNENGEKIFERLESRHGEIRRQLGLQLGKRTRKIPDIAFHHDEIEEEASRIDRLIAELKIPPAKDES